jgi:hypothetical protein
MGMAAERAQRVIGNRRHQCTSRRCSSLS